MTYPRYVIEKCGSFDEKYEGNIAEDADFSFRVRKLGFRLIVDPDLQLIHENVGGTAFPYSEHDVYYSALNNVYFFFKNLYDGKARSLIGFTKATIYMFGIHLIGGLVYKRPCIGLFYFRGIVNGFRRMRLLMKNSLVTSIR